MSYWHFSQLSGRRQIICLLGYKISTAEAMHAPQFNKGECHDRTPVEKNPERGMTCIQPISHGLQSCSDNLWFCMITARHKARFDSLALLLAGLIIGIKAPSNQSVSCLRIVK